MMLPIAMDDPINDPFPMANPRSAEAWAERQRRQRTIRLLMTFLVILILMDGEEPNRRRRREQNLRYRNGMSQKVNAGDGNGNGANNRSSSLMEESLFDARRVMDQRIFDAVQSHARLKDLNELNSGRDEEKDVIKWVEEEMQRREEEGLLKDVGGSKDSTVAGFKSSYISFKKEKKEVAVDEEQSRLVYHYPRNATGYYRGEWKLLGGSTRENDNVIGEDENLEQTQSQAAEREMKDTSEDVNEGQNEAKKNEPIDVIDNIPTGDDELIERIREKAKLKGDTVGVYLLPEGTQLLGPNLINSTTENEDTSTQSSSLLFQGKAAKYEERYVNEYFADTEKPKKTSLSLTHESGRIVFQLYSRSIPALQQLSLLDGFVKIHDLNNAGFSTRRDILLRVRGIVIHSIGRVSLVANDGLWRSALVLFEDDDVIRKSKQPKKVGHKNKRKSYKYRKVDGIEEAGTKGNHDDDVVRRNLQESVSGLISQVEISTDKNNSDSLLTLEQIRDDALAAYSDLWEDDQIGGKDWDEHISTESDSESKITPRTYNSDIAKDVATDYSHNIGTSRRALMGKTTPIDEDEGEQEKEESVDLISEKKLNRNSTLLMNSSISSELQQRKLEDSWSLFESKRIFPYPYVPDDMKYSLRKGPPQIRQKISVSELAYLKNGAGCEFQLNLDMKETQWSVGEWRTMVDRQMQDMQALDPSKQIDDESIIDKSAQTSLGYSTVYDAPAKTVRDESLVMNLIGTIESPNCNFLSSVNVTAIRTDWEHTTGKAINYSFYMMLTCLTQIVVLLRQLLHTQAQSAATRVSLTCIGWQTVLDALMCFGHILLCIMMQPLFTAFAFVAFFKLLIFCVIEMKYMVLIIQARNVLENNENNNESLRRRVAILHFRFYSGLVLALVLLMYMGQNHRTLYLLLLYSFWIPQIVQNIITEAKKPLHKYYIYGMSFSRLVAPLYVFGVPNNFLKEVEPDFASDPLTCEALVLWVGFQALILVAQGKYGARFMIPARFLPPKFDYSRPIPESLLPQPSSISNGHNSGSEMESNALLGDGTSGENSTGPRNRMKSRAGTRTSEETNGTTTVDEHHANDQPYCVDCVICHNGINIRNRRGYMLAPCDHIFHRECLEQWMEVKMECPICRHDLPAL